MYKRCNMKACRSARVSILRKNHYTPLTHAGARALACLVQGERDLHSGLAAADLLTLTYARYRAPHDQVLARRRWLQEINLRPRSHGCCQPIHSLYKELMYMQRAKGPPALSRG